LEERSGKVIKGNMCFYGDEICGEFELVGETSLGDELFDSILI
jgi:hypothetical protein